ncbi:MAG: conserved membrane protein of unknown function [Candidatus Thorarchaeota archaeon]|nr:MAG: conserved membrane protein of unknown function [Candidatus Thorarchaeota archaeon]
MTDSPKSEHHRKTFKESIAADKFELTVFGILIVLYFYLRLSGIEPTIVLILGLVCGTWLAFRPSEWAVEGIESAAGHLGFTAYVAGMLSSLASNMPEAAISGIAAYTGEITNQPELKTIAVLSVLIAAGFNMVLLGLTIIIATKGKDDMPVPEEAIKKDSVLIRWTIVALVAIFALGIVDVAFAENGNAQFFIPWEASFILFFSYIVYAYSLATDDVSEETELAEAHHSRRIAAILAVIGFIGIFFAGEMLTSSVEILLHDYNHVIAEYANPVTIAALILGAAGAIPEHGIALIAAARGKIGLAVGNLIGGVLQIILLVGGGIGIFVLIPMNRYVLFQLIVIAGSLWFLKRAIADDHHLDLFEGAMIILLQAYVFALLVWGTPI